MARRSQQVSHQESDATPSQGGGSTEVPNGSKVEHLLIFRIADGLFGFRLDHVAQIVRLPVLAHMPLGPRSLLGLANLRGLILPVIMMRRLLGLADMPLDDAARVIVIDRGAPVGFVIDRIDSLLSVPAGRLEKDDTGAGATNPDLLDGIVKGAELDSTIKILNPQRLLRDEFARLGVSGPRAATGASIAAATSGAPVVQPRRQVSLVSFDLGRQEYGLPLERVQEIIPLPDHVSEVPRPETAVLGVVTLRDRLLPLVSLRALLGLAGDLPAERRGRVVVVSIGTGAVGVVADRTREILRVDPSLIDAAPALLTRGAGDAEITSICRLDHGRRLVAVLSPDRLFRSDLVRRVLAEQADPGAGPESRTDGNAMADEQFIVFRLGEQEFGLPIAAVDEIARPPDHFTKLPKAPAFIDGVMNLRGHVVPIIDLRRRFDLTSREPGSAQRILVLAVGNGKAGFVVDGVSEVMKVPQDAIQPAPELSSEQTRLIGRIATLDAQNRLILLVDPNQLLDRVEAEVLSRFHRTGLEKAPKAK
jgi:purine-binding chemotaxis protein CheW